MSPNWICREFAWLVTCLKEPEVTLVFGPMKRGWFHAFSAELHAYTLGGMEILRNAEVPVGDLVTRRSVCVAKTDLIITVTSPRDPIHTVLVQTSDLLQTRADGSGSVMR